MSTLLLPRASALLRGAHSSRVRLAPGNRVSVVASTKRNPKTLASLFKRPLTSHQVTSLALSNYMTVRNYSSREARKAQRQAQTAYREDEYPRETQRTDLAPTQSNTPSQQYEPYEYERQERQAGGFAPDRTSEELITPHVMAHLRKVYSLLGVASGVAALGGIAAVGLAVPSGVALACGLGALVPMLGTFFMSKEKVLLRQNLFLAAAALMGIGAGPLFAAVSISTILLALGGTGAIFAGFTLAALKAPSASYVKFGGVALGAIIVLCLAGLLSVFGGALGIPASALAALSSFNLYGGLAIFSLFIAFDTQLMIDRAAAGETDHVSDALSLFIDVWGIFIRLLRIFSDD